MKAAPLKLNPPFSDILIPGRLPRNFSQCGFILRAIQKLPGSFPDFPEVPGLPPRSTLFEQSGHVLPDFCVHTFALSVGGWGFWHVSGGTRGKQGNNKNVLQKSREFLLVGNEKSGRIGWTRMSGSRTSGSSRPSSGVQVHAVFSFIS